MKDSLVASVAQRLIKYISPPDAILVAFSGGPDSVALALVLREAGYTVYLAYVNHNLRGPASQAEEEWVRAWAERQALPLFVKKLDPTTLQGGRGLQAEARRIRYTWMQQLLSRYAISWGATAHTLDDQVETLLYRFIRSGLRQTWKGIPYKRGPWLRPLLYTTRNQIIHFLRERNAAYLLDTSNYTPKYLRNQVRWRLLPPIYLINPSFRQLLIERYSLYQYQQKHLLRLYAYWEKKSFQYKPYGEMLHRKLPKDAFYYIIGKRWNLDSQGIVRLWQLWRAERSGARLELGGFTYVRTPNGIARGASVFWQPAWPPLVISTEEGTFQWGFWHIQVGCSSNPPPDALTWAKARIRFPLLLRLWRKGDRLAPHGLEGKSKKVSDIWGEVKLYGFERQHGFVIEDHTGKIIGVAGYRPSYDTAWTPLSGESFYLRAQYGHPL
ncbi:MAG: tRNA lysidine(34) synthetase TilS [Bacteroidia bacterium]